MTLAYCTDFPPVNIELGNLAALIGRANACLSRYDGLLEGLINPDVLLSPLMMKEAELSSRIEGTIATANEVYKQQAGETFDAEKTADIHEILNYRSTLRIAGQLIQERPFSASLVRQMHQELMQGVRGQDKNPGRFRTTQNWIGPRGCTIETASYVPPLPLRIPDLLEDFIAFANNNDEALDPIIQAALLHAQFELIHPFDDGNGRIGRILIPLALVRRNSITSPSFYISGYFEERRDVYYGKLESISREGRWESWLEFFLRAVITQSERNLTLARRIHQLYEQKKTELAQLLRSEQSIHILDMLFDTPVFQGNQLHQRLDIQRQRAAGYIRQMKEAGILVELRASSGRRPALLSFEELWRITDDQ